MPQRNGKRLSIFVGEYQRYYHQPLAEAILERAREEGLAGGTMARGIEGFGHSGRLKTTRFLSSSDDLPIVIDIVDEAHRVEAFLPILETMLSDGLVVVSEVAILSRKGPHSYPLDDDLG